MGMRLGRSGFRTPLVLVFAVVSAVASSGCALDAGEPVGQSEELQVAATLPDGFVAEYLAQDLSFPKGVFWAPAPAVARGYPAGVYVANSNTNRIARIPETGGSSVTFGANTGPFPVGVGFFGGPFDWDLYACNAFGGPLVRIDTSGAVTPFACAGLSIAGLDQGEGFGFGNDLYVGEWPYGRILRVDAAGNSSVFSSNPGTETRYLKFGQGGGFGFFLYYSDFSTGNVYRVSPDGTATLFAQTGAVGLEGMDFSPPGGPFGSFLYAGSLVTGQIFRIAPDGTSSVWASGFPGVADIDFRCHCRHRVGDLDLHHGRFGDHDKGFDGRECGASKHGNHPGKDANPGKKKGSKIDPNEDVVMYIVDGGNPVGAAYVIGKQGR